MIFRKNILFSFIFLLLLLMMNYAIIEAEEFEDEKMIITEVRIEDNFSDDVVIIVLKHDVSLEFIDYTLDDFEDIECIKVEDLTEYTTKIVKDEIEAKRTGDYSGLKRRIDNNMLVNIDKFHRILCLYLRYPGKENVINAIRILEKRNDIISAEPDYIVNIDISPNDSYYSSGDLWGLNGTFGINASNAWNYSTGNSNLLVGILDSGIDATHPDLINNINADLHRDFVTGPWYVIYTDVSIDELTDENGHGTHVAGIIGAQGNNNLGICGVSWNIKMVSLRVFDQDGEGKNRYIKRAIDYATSVNIKILNLSGGSSYNHSGMQNAIQNYPGLFVCAAGNEDNDNDINNHFPSNYNLPNLISVGAIKSNGDRPTVIDWGYADAPFNTMPQGSNYGLTTVDIFAPGDNIISTYPSGLYDPLDTSGRHIAVGYYIASGTSMATPFVTGVAALMASINLNLTPQQIKSTIMNNSIKYSTLTNLCVCGGRLDAYKAIAAVTLNTSTVGDNIKVNGFINGYTPPINMNLKIPESFAQISSTYGTLEQNVQFIGDGAFYNYSNIKMLELPNTISIIDSNAFENCSNLQSVTLSTNLLSIGSLSFKGCILLESITIPSSMLSIGDYAFSFCSSLSEVIVLKDTNPLTVLGEHAFDNCNPNLEIKVPINRGNDYKTSAYWSSYSDRIVPNIGITSTIGIDCLTEDDIDVILLTGEKKYYKLVIDCGKSYRFIADSSHEVIMTIYNSNMVLICSNSEDNNDNTLIGYLSPGIYYLEIKYAIDYHSGLFELEYSPTYLVNHSSLAFGINNIQSSIHSISGNKKHGYYYYNHTLGEGFFKFCLNGGYSNNYPASAITIYTDNNKTNILERYPINNSINAVSNLNENELYIYIPSNGTYYIDILLYAGNSMNTTFTISTLDTSIMDYSNNLQYLSFSPILENQNTFSYFKEITISHKSKMQIDVISLGTIYEDIPIYLYKRELEPGNEPEVIDYIYNLISNSSWKITSSSYGPLFTIVLEAGTYYLGYSNNGNNIGISFALRRIVDYEASSLGTLITDPVLNQGFTLGSEVNFNNGLVQGTTITEGFTRCIYLMFDNFIELPNSRLDYDWYSSNDTVAEVTHYGTVLGKPVNTNTNVTIYAVLKIDPSVVFNIVLTILDDTETDEIEITSYLSYSYSLENGTYQLELDNTNSPYPLINNYMWSIDVPTEYPNLEVTMNQWGYITSNGTGSATFTANYHLNQRVYLIIYLTITT